MLTHRKPTVGKGPFRFLLFVSLASAAMLLLSAAPASAQSTAGAYLALGESTTFGTNPVASPTVSSNFTGYPNDVAQTLNLTLFNPSCPGETTQHFLSVY